MICSFWQFFFSVFLAFLLQPTTGDLLFLQAIWRHGDRSPIRTFPTDTNTIDTWLNGFGELSVLGIRQQFDLGVYMRDRYKHFLSDDYKASEIRVVSTDYNRTIMSAMANLAGMFPPTRKNDLSAASLWSLWQPIPIHNWPTDIMEPDCPIKKTISQQIQTSSAALQLMSDNRDLLEFLRLKTGSSLAAPHDIVVIYDSLICEKFHLDTNPWPQWMNDSLMERIVTLYNQARMLTAEHPILKVINGGPILGYISEQMRSAEGRQLKYLGYSGHDSIVEPLLISLGDFNGQVPPYASVVLIELHTDATKKNLWVEIYFRNETGREPFPMTIEGCGRPCRLDDFLKRNQPFLLKDLKSQCGLRAETNGLHNWKILTSVAFSLLLVILIALVLLVIRYRKELNRNCQPF